MKPFPPSAYAWLQLVCSSCFFLSISRANHYTELDLPNAWNAPQANLPPVHIRDWRAEIFDFRGISNRIIKHSPHPAAPLKIGNSTIDCAVLEDGTRVITQSSFLRAIGRSIRPAAGQGWTQKIQTSPMVDRGGRASGACPTFARHDCPYAGITGLAQIYADDECCFAEKKRPTSFAFG